MELNQPAHIPNENKIDSNVRVRVENHSVNIKDVLIKYWNYKLLFLGSILSFLFFTYSYLYFKVPLYSSSIKVLLRSGSSYSGSGKSSNGTGDLGLGVVSYNRSNIANEVEIIKTTSLMERVVEKDNLNSEIFYLGRARSAEVYDKTGIPLVKFEHITDSTKVHSVKVGNIGNKIYYIKKGKIVYIKNYESIPLGDGADFRVNFSLDNVSSKVKNDYLCIWHPTREIASRIASGIGSGPLNKDATILVLSYTYPIPKKSEDILNELANQYSLLSIEEKNQAIDNTLLFIDDRLKIIGKDLGSVEDSMLHFKQKENALDLRAQLSTGLGKTEGLKNKLSEITVKMQVCDMLSEYINNPKRRFSLIPSNLGIEDMTLTQLVHEYNENVTKRELLLKTMPEGNILVKQVESALDQIRVKTLESIRNVKSEFYNSYSHDNNEFESITSEIKRIPGKEIVLSDIERQQQIKIRLYMYLLEKREEGAISKASAVSSSNPLGEATSSGPIGAQSSLIYTLSFILGIGFPVLIIFVKDFLNDKIITKKDIEEISSIPIIGDVGHQKNIGKEILQNSRSKVSEQLRLLVTNFQYFLNVKLPSKVLLITSTVKGEGKSFISMNLASALARSGKKTIVLEFDLRRPRISKSIGLPNEIGLSNFLSGNYEVNELIKPIPEFENLYIISSGIVPPNPAELLLLEDKLQELFDKLRETYEYIIVDTAPLGLVSDARSLSKFSDFNLYIVRHRYTLKSHIAFIDSLYSNNLIPNLALIINDATATGASSYYSGYGSGGGNYLYGAYYGYTYGYGYSYNYGYTSDSTDKKKSIFSWLKKNND